MKRRDAIFAGLIAFSCALNTRAIAQQRVYRIGYLSQPTRESVEPVLRVFLQALRDLGWIEGQNVVIEYRWADGQNERLPALADELVKSGVDVIVAPSAAAAAAAKRATSTIPIVMIFPANPVELGLVASLARPGGNVTGTAYAHDTEIYRKQLQLLVEAVPRASRIAVLQNPLDPTAALQRRELDAAAPAMGVTLQFVQARSAADFERAFAEISRGKAQALLVSASATYLAQRKQLAAAVRSAKLPSMYSLHEMVEAGGLMAYAANLSDFVGRSAGYVDKILRGANPADLAVQQPEKFELVINTRTMRELGITIPPSVMVQAVRVE